MRLRHMVNAVPPAAGGSVALGRPSGTALSCRHGASARLHPGAREVSRAVNPIDRFRALAAVRMTLAIAIHALKDRSVAAAGISHEAMHVYVGFALFLAALLFAYRRGPLFALNVVVAAEFVNEVLDALAKGLMWRDIASDIVMTLAGPVLLTLLLLARSPLGPRPRDLPVAG